MGMLAQGTPGEARTTFQPLLLANGARPLPALRADGALAISTRLAASGADHQRRSTGPPAPKSAVNGPDGSSRSRVAHQAPATNPTLIPITRKMKAVIPMIIVAKIMSGFIASFSLDSYIQFAKKPR